MVVGVLGAALVLAAVWYIHSNRASQQRAAARRGKRQIPGWDSDPADAKSGDLVALRSAGSLQDYLMMRHEGGRCPVIAFWWGNRRVVSVSSPDTFKDTENLYNRPSNIFSSCVEPLNGPESIISMNDAEWEKRRKLLYSTVRGTRLGSFFEPLIRIAQETERKWTPGMSIVTRKVFRITLKGILDTSLLDIFEDDSGIDEFIEVYHACKTEMDDRIISPSPSADSKREKDFQGNRKQLMGFLKQMIEVRRSQKNSKEVRPLLDVLLNSGAPEEQILSDMVAFVGGFHTVGFFATWLLYYLARNCHVQDKLCREIKEKVGNDYGEKLKMYTLSSDSYLRQVIDEALRMSATAAFEAHYCNEDLIVGEYCVPAKTPIIHAIGVVMGDEQIWTNPGTFDPDRFAPGSKHAKRGTEFRPFAVPNTRRCPANHFSYLMMSVYISVLLRRFVITSTVEDTSGKVFGIATSPGDAVSINIQLRTDF